MYNRLCFFSIIDSEYILKSDTLFFSDSYAYWIPNDIGSKSHSVDLTSLTNSTVTKIITTTTLSQIYISLKPTKYYTCSKSLNIPIEIVDIYDLSDYDISITGSLKIENFEIAGFAENNTYYALSISKSPNYGYMIFAYICEKQFTVENITVLLEYDIEWNYEFPELPHACYYTESIFFTFEECNGVMHWANPKEDVNVTIVVQDPRYEDVEFMLSLIVSKVPFFKEFDTKCMLMYTNIESVITLEAVNFESSTIEYDSSLFSMTLSDSKIIFTSFFTETAYNILTPVTIWNSDFSSIYFINLFVYPSHIPTFLDIPVTCFIQILNTIDLSNCKFYIDILFYNPDYLTHSISTNVTSLSNFTITFIPEFSEYYFTVTAKSGEFSGEKTYKLQCEYILQIEVDTSVLVYAEVKTVIPVSVKRNGISLAVSGLVGLWLENSPSEMYLDENGFIIWTPLQSYSNSTVEFLVRAEDKDPGISCKVYLDTKSVSIMVLPHLLPDVDSKRIDEKYMNCTLPSSIYTDSCFLDKSLNEVFETNQVIYELLYPTDNTIIVNENDIVFWVRTSLISPVLTPSSYIIFKATDSLQGTTYTFPFYFTPNYIPEISDLISSTTEALYTAYYKCLWTRSFTITDGLFTYPSESFEGISVSVSTNESIILSKGTLTWTPSLSSTYSYITIQYTDSDSAFSERIFTINVLSNSLPSCDSMQIQRPLYELEKFSLNLNAICTDPDNESILFTLLIGPASMVLSDNTLLWQTTEADIGKQKTITVGMTNIHKTCPEIFTFTIVPQPKLVITLNTTQMDYGISFRAQASIEKFSYFNISMLTFSIESSISDIKIDSQYGIVTWNKPIQDIDITINVNLADGFYSSDSSYKTFSLLIRYSSLKPQFYDTIPLSIDMRKGFSNNPWLLDVKCYSPLEDVTIELTEGSFTFSDLKLNYTPPVDASDSSLVTLSCTGIKSLNTVTYSFILAPIDSQSPPPTCSDMTIDAVYKTTIQTQLSYNWVLRDHYLGNISLSTTLDDFPGLQLFPHGYLYWNSVKHPISDNFPVTISDTSKTSVCTITVSFTNSTDSPKILNKNSFLCEIPPCSLTIEYTGDLSEISTNSTNLKKLNDTTFEWNPPSGKLFEVINFTASNQGGSDSLSIIACQNNKCRMWPSIESVTSNNCTIIGTMLTCEYLYVGVYIEITIKGRNFGSSCEVLVGNKYCEVISSNETEIICKLPPPDFDLDENLVVVKRTDINMYSPGYVIKFVHYKNRIFTVAVPELSPFYAVLNEEDYFRLPIVADFLMEGCTCSASGTTGIFYYISRNFSECRIPKMSSGVYELNFCCFSYCSSYSFNAVDDLEISSVYELQMSSHGRHNVTIEYKFTGVCIEDNIIFKVGDNYIKGNSPCSYKVSLLVPPQTISLSSIDITLSLNKGFSYYGYPLKLSLTGLCSLGQYLLDGNCEDCPVGYYCDVDFKTEYDYLYSPKPCDLGYYQDQKGQSSCEVCPPGAQCFCRGMEKYELCDAGFICENSKTIKRSKPCPKGLYCEKGTKTTVGDESGSAYLCPEGSYCIYGIYTSVTNDSDYYAPHNCNKGVDCPAGSSNPDGIVDCADGYFCIGQKTEITNDMKDYIPDASKCVNGKCECAPGYYCVGLSLTKPIMCPKGFYQSKFKQTECEECLEGHYCPWADNSGPKIQKECEKGQYCDKGKIEGTNCTMGTYQDQKGKSYCNDCQRGSYASSSGTVTCTKCEKSYFCPSLGMTSADPCPAKYYCAVEGIWDNITTIDLELPDLAEGETNPNSPQQCSRGHYCLEKTSDPRECSVGYYQDLPGQNECKSCTPGNLCTQTGMINPSPCPAGYYCIDNQKYPCPEGYYCLAETNTSDINASHDYKPWPCLNGTFCVGGNTNGVYSLNDPNSAQNCSIGTYNDKEAQTKCIECPAGYECIYEGMDKPFICNVGKYRPSGLIPEECIDCPIGTYNNQTGSTSEDNCTLCRAGVYCTESGADNDTYAPKCPAGYYCLAGTSSDRKNDYPCLGGYYCLEGTASEEESRLHKCPAGRLCYNATGAEAVDECPNPLICEIGEICSENNYCPEGTTEAKACPSGYKSSIGSTSIENCIRSLDNFYDVQTTTSTTLFETNLTDIGYYEFSMDILKYFLNLTTPQNYQILITLKFYSNTRRLADDEVTQLLITNIYYGTRLSIPLIYSSKDILELSNLRIGLQLNVPATVEIRFQNINLMSSSSNDIDESSKVFQLILSQPAQDGFICVLTNEISQIIEEPINLYSTIYMYNNGSKPIYDENPSFENRYSLTLVTDDYSKLINTKSEQMSSSIWSGNDLKTKVLTYIPYITNCFPMFGAYIPINVLINSSECSDPNTKVYTSPLEFYKKPQNKHCMLNLTCDYSLDISNTKRSMRWYESYTEEHNARDSSKVSVPLFYISKRPLKKQQIIDLSLERLEATFDMIKVTSEIKITNTSWQIGDVPGIVRFIIGYYQSDHNNIQILKAHMVFEELTESKYHNDSLYTLYFEYYPLDWMNCFNVNAFTEDQYFFLLFVFASFIVAAVMFCALVSFVFFPKSRRIKGIKYVLWSVVNSFLGMFLALIPVCTVLFSVWMVLYYEGALDYTVGNYNDTLPIKDTNSERVLLYRTGRFGISLFTISLVCLCWGVDLAIPIRELSGMGYEKEKQKLDETSENPRNQGPLAFWMLLVVVLCTLFDTLGQQPEYTSYYIIIIPLLQAFEYLLDFLCLKDIKDFFYAVPIKLGLRIGIFMMILNCRNLSSMIGSFCVIFICRVLCQSILEKYSQDFIISYIAKAFEKLSFSIYNRDPIRTKNVLTINEICDKSVSFVLMYLYPLIVLAIYLYYPNISYRMIQEHFVYFLVFIGYFTAYEPFISISVSAIRSTRDSEYTLSSLYKKLQYGYTKRSVVWALTMQSFEDSNVKFTPESENQCKIAWSVQYYFTVSILGIGVFLFVFSIKMWQDASYAPYLDLWLTIIAGMTYVACAVVKVICKIVGSKLIWRIPQLNLLYKRGIDGKVIQSHSDFIMDIVLQKEINKLKIEETKTSISVNELTEKVMDILKNGTNNNIVLIKLFRVFSELNLGKRIDVMKVFEHVTTAKSVFSIKYIEEKIGKTIDPSVKIGLIKEKNERQGKRISHFPSELIYPWPLALIPDLGIDELIDCS